MKCPRCKWVDKKAAKGLVDEAYRLKLHLWASHGDPFPSYTTKFDGVDVTK